MDTLLTSIGTKFITNVIGNKQFDQILSTQASRVEPQFRNEKWILIQRKARQFYNTSSQSLDRRAAWLEEKFQVFFLKDGVVVWVMHLSLILCFLFIIIMYTPYTLAIVSLRKNFLDERFFWTAELDSSLPSYSISMHFLKTAVGLVLCKTEQAFQTFLYLRYHRPAHNGA